MAVINGNADNNYMVGTVGDDVLNGEGGIDTLEADLGNDTLNGGLDNDYLYGGEGNDVLNGDEGVDELRGEAGDDVLYGGAGDFEYLYGGTGNDSLYGGESYYDILYGDAGNDLLNGGLGDEDRLRGGQGVDTYQFGRGYGKDKAEDSSYNGTEINTIQLLADIAVSDVRLTRINQDLQLSVVGTTDSLTLQDYFYVNSNNSTPNQAYQIQFADGTTWDKAAIQTSIEALATTGTAGIDTLIGDASDNNINGLAGNDYLYGGDGNDVLNGDEGVDELRGEAGDDVLYGGAGDFEYLYGGTGNDSLYGGESYYDILYGDAGNDLLNGGLGDEDRLRGGQGVDTYQFGRGYGKDKAEDSSYNGTEINTIQLLADIAVSDVRLTRINQDLQLSVVGTTDSLTLQDYFYVNSNNSTPNQAYQIQFADGTTWDKTAIRAKVLESAIIGTELNDALDGAENNDYMASLAGDDVLNGEGGIDTLEADLGNDTLNGGLDTDYLYGGEGNDVLNGDEGVDELRGEAGDDVLYGGAGDFEYLYGGTGNDSLYGGESYYDILYGDAGNDLLNGGLGDEDRLRGGQGVDTYQFGRGYGKDKAEDSSYNGTEINTIQLLADIAVSDVRLTRINQDLQLSVVGTTDSLTLQDYFYVNSNNSTPNQAYQIQFADGTTWDKTTIRNKVLETAIIGTAGNDTLVGGDTNDSISGGAGNDSIDAGAGNDLIEGGTGADTLNGGAGDDTYVADGSDTINETPDGGTDTIQTPDDITLPDNVENLNQTGTGNTTGTGNNLDNTMTGNTGNNQLDGTAGNDTLTGGTGADTLIGGLGDDVLNGSDGNDVFIGGAGNDIISGGRGSDTVYFNLGDGNDIIDNQTDDINTTTDVLVFGQGIALNDLTFMRYNNSADSTVLINGTTDSILVKNYFSQPQYYNNIQLHFADGTVVTYQQLLHMGYVNQGDDSNNALNGFWGNDTLIGGLGDDTLIGGLGTDSYQLGLGDDTVIYHYNQDGGDYVADDLTNEQINAGISDGIDTYKIFNVPNSPVIQFGIEANTERYPNLVLTIGDNNVNLGTQFADDWRDSVSVGWQGIYIENFFTRNPAGSNNGTPVLTAASAQDVFVFYSDDGVTEINRLTGQEVYDFYFAPQNHAPVLTGTPATLANGTEDTVYTVYVSDLLQGYTDADGDTLSVINLQATHGSLVDNQNGTYSFTPNANFNGAVNLSYQVSDGHGGIAEASNSFVLDAVNDIPFISNMSGEVGEDGFITGGGGYYDVEGDVLSYRIIGDVPEGFVLDGNNGAFGFSYTPTVADQTLKVGESKQLSVQYVANDGQADSLPATIQITINGVNDAPTGSAIVTLPNATANTTYTLLATDLLQGFSDVDGDTLNIANLNADHATVVNNSNGTFTLTLETNYSGVVGLSYQVIDGHNGSINAMQSFNVVASSNTTGTTGADTLVGSNLDDVYVVNHVRDVVVEDINGGIDTVESTISYVLKDNLENLTLLGSSNISGTGNTANNVLTGNDGNNRLLAGLGNDTLYGGAGGDTLNGGEGADQMFGGAGNDTFTVENANDLVVELTNEGYDTINSFVSYTLTANVERLNLENAGGQINGFGNELDNTLNGNNFANWLVGGAGNDTLQGKGGTDTLEGGLGDDVYYVDNIGDVVTELAGEGTDKVNSTVSYTLTANVEQLYLTGIASLSGTGNGQNNIIYGNSGNNLLSGGAGNDSLNGGAGNDTLDGGQGNDTLVGGLGNDTYLLGVGSGRDTIDNKDSVGNDVLLLGTGVTAEQVWLRQLGNDLEVSIIGTNNSAKIKGWYSGNADSQLDSLQLADGRTLLTNEVQTLVDAMAAFAPPALGQTTLTNEQQAALSIVITTNW